MYLKSKKVALLLLVVASIICSKIAFWFLNDPEGPNLLVVFGLAVVMYGVSLIGYFLSPWPISKKLFLAILIQALIVFCLNLL